MALTSGKSELQAESVAFEAGVSEQLGRLSEAIKAYESSLSSNLTFDLRREAFYKVINLTIKQNKIELAAQKLEGLFAKTPNDKSSDLALLTSGRIATSPSLSKHAWSRNCSSNPNFNTNLFYQAKGKFERLINTFTNSEFLGDAQLNLGWRWMVGKQAS